jgi:hypothetical protein
MEKNGSATPAVGKKGSEQTIDTRGGDAALDMRSSAVENCRLIQNWFTGRSALDNFKLL